MASGVVLRRAHCSVEFSVREGAVCEAGLKEIQKGLSAFFIEQSLFSVCDVIWAAKEGSLFADWLLK